MRQRTKIPYEWIDPWIGTIVQFVCGALVGSLIGFEIFTECLESDWGWLAIPITSLACGILAALFGDSFWEAWKHI